MFESLSKFRFWFFGLPYLVIFYGALFLTVVLWYGAPDAIHFSFIRHALLFTPIHVLWLLALFIHNFFEIRYLRSLRAIFFSLTTTSFVNIFIAITYFYFQPALALTPRRFLLMDVLLVYVLLAIYLVFIRYFSIKHFVLKVYFLSAHGTWKDMEHVLGQLLGVGYVFAGYLDASNLSSASKDGRIVTVVLPDSGDIIPGDLKHIYAMRSKGVVFHNYRDFTELLTRTVQLSKINELWFLENVRYQDSLVYNFLKRCLDLFCGLLGVTVFLITYPLFALLIKTSVKDSVIFKQKRMGKFGHIFTIYKYRTMSGGDGVTWTSPNDTRITWVGKIFRLTRMDELPQAINLLLGNMSLVGPRPEQVHIAEELAEHISFYDERHMVKPGLTGWAQLHVYAASVDESRVKLQYDLYYIKHRSFLFDLEIIIKTIYHLVGAKGR